MCSYLLGISFGVSGLGYPFWGSFKDLVFRVQCLGFGVSDAGFKVLGGFGGSVKTLRVLSGLYRGCQWM